jgi:hypothetical protein
MEWRKLYSKALNNLYFSPNCIRINTSRELDGQGHVTPIRKIINMQFLLEKRKNIEGTGIDGRITNGFYKTYRVTIWLRVASSCVHSTNPCIP